MMMSSSKKPGTGRKSIEALLERGPGKGKVEESYEEELEPEEESMEVDEPQSIGGSALEDISDDELLAELKKRGLGSNDMEFGTESEMA